jgi:uncharacterized protein (DUF433 family)
MNGITRRAHVAGGEPTVEGSDIRTADLLELFLGGKTIDALAELHKLSRWQVEQALRFECCKACPCEACAWTRELPLSPAKAPPRPPIPVPPPKRIR